MANGDARRKVTRAIIDYGKSAVKKYKTKRDPKLVVAGVNPKATLGSDDFDKSEKVVRKYGKAKAVTALAAGYTIGATDAIPKAYKAGKYVYDALTEKSSRDSSKKGATTTAKPSTASSAKANASKVTQARKEQLVANTQKTKANKQMTKATTNKEKVAANKTKVAANARMVAANKKKVAANTARYKK